MENITFEEALARLQEIVRQLENGDLPLERSLELFEEGIGLFKRCQNELQIAEGRISKLIKTLEGEWSTEPMEL